MYSEPLNVGIITEILGRFSFIEKPYHILVVTRKSGPVKIVVAPYRKRISESFKGVDECVVVDISTLDSEQTFQFRSDMRASSISVKGIKNSLTKKALEGSAIEGVSEVLKGACTITFSDQDSVTLAKTLVEWAKNNDNLGIKGGFTEGNVLFEKDVISLSKMPSRDELLSTISGQIMGPASQIASQITAPASNVAGAVKTHIENQEKSS